MGPNGKMIHPRGRCLETKEWYFLKMETCSDFDQTLG